MSREKQFCRNFKNNLQNLGNPSKIEKAAVGF